MPPATTTGGVPAAAAACGAAVAPPLYHRTLFKRILILPTLAEAVRIERLSGADTGIIELKLDWPEMKNAISKERITGRSGGDRCRRVGEGRHVCSAVPGLFCAGANLKERRLMNISEVQLYVDSLRATLSSFEVLPVPTIAVIEGPALGGGLDLALSCDLRICGEDAIFGMPETGLAVIPGAGGTQRLPRIVGKSVAKELIFTCRRIDGKEAKSIGLVSDCTPSGDAYLKSIQIAREINQKGPLAIRMAKQAIDRGMEVDITAALAVEGECYAQLLDTGDRLEGLAAVAEKRKPRFTGK